MSRFNEDDLIECKKLFNRGRSSKDVQDYLIEKHNLSKRSYTSNFVKMVRKNMGIYKAKS